MPDDVDETVPNAARVYDFALGGQHNFHADREFWRAVEQQMPDARLIAQANRAFLGRAVEWLVEAGVRQFVDIGSGIPTLGNVHEIAHGAAADARVVYVDIDPVAVTQSKALLKDDPQTRVIMADLRRPEEIFYHPTVLEFLDFGEPVAVLLVAVLHFIDDEDDPAGIIRRIGEVLVSGSYLVVSHAAPDPSHERREAQETVRKLYDRTPTAVRLRTREELMQIVAGFEIVTPGVVPATSWNPDPEADEAPQPVAIALVARRP